MVRGALGHSPELLEKRVALTPRPEVSVLLDHEVLAPHARWRSQVVGFRRLAASEAAAARRAEPGASRGPRCGSWLRRIATVEDPTVVGTILAHLSLLHPGDSPGRPRRRPTYSPPPRPVSHPSLSRS